MRVRTVAVWSKVLTIEDFHGRQLHTDPACEHGMNGKLVVQDDIEEGAENSYAVVVVNEAQCPGLTQKETDS